jgi:hypothetical protein
LSDPWKSFDSSQLPLFAAVAGVELPVEEYAIAPGLKLARAYIDVFGIPMMSFAAPVNPGAAHPGPWVAVRGSSNFESRAELQLSTELAGDIPPHTIIWLIADLLRIHLHTPIRVPVLGNMSFRSMADHHKEALGHSFEASPNQVGLYLWTASNNFGAWANRPTRHLPKIAPTFHQRAFRSNLHHF